MATCDVNLVQNALGIQQTGPRTVIVPADPIIWSADKSYEYLTLVATTDFGQAYISKRDVPAGTPLTNTTYWIPAARYNAQLAQLEKAMQTLDGRITENENSIENLYATNNFVTPELFGAKGDGVTDDTAAVQSAFDADKNVLVNNHYKVSDVTLSKAKTVFGYGTLEGRVFLGSTTEMIPGINVRDITVIGTMFLNNYRDSYIENVTFNSGTDYAIKRNANIAIAKHHIGYFTVTKCRVSGKGFIYLEKQVGDDDLPFNDISVIENTANPITDFFFYSDVQDGCKIYNNKMQYPSYGAADKTSCIYIGKGDFCSIVGNTIFETGEEAIICDLLNNSIIANNNIGWCGEQKICSAIRVNVGQTLIPKHIIIANNSITYQSGYCIEIDNIRFASITGNTCKWSKTPPYLGRDNCIQDMSDAQGYLKINDNVLYSTITGNSLEGTYITAPDSHQSNTLANNTTDITQYYESIPVVKTTVVSSNLNMLQSPIMIINPSTPVTVTDFNRYLEGQVTHIFNASANNVTFTNNSVLQLKGKMNQVIGEFESISFVCHDGKAYQI